MPIYEYKCEVCQLVFERLVFAGDEERVFCPECGSENIQKLMSSSRFMSSGLAGACTSGKSAGFS